MKITNCFVVQRIEIYFHSHCARKYSLCRFLDVKKLKNLKNSTRLHGNFKNINSFFVLKSRSFVKNQILQNEKVSGNTVYGNAALSIGQFSLLYSLKDLKSKNNMSSS
jgi:hypothetical protein